MAMRVLCVNFNIDMTAEEYRNLADQVAPQIALVPGLIRKTWIINRQAREAGGLYLFQDQQSLDAYINGPVISHLRGMKEVSSLSIQQFDVLEEASAVTRGIDQPLAKASRT